jgi:hypothetical protein
MGLRLHHRIENASVCHINLDVWTEAQAIEPAHLRVPGQSGQLAVGDEFPAETLTLLTNALLAADRDAVRSASTAQIFFAAANGIAGRTRDAVTLAV